MNDKGHRAFGIDGKQMAFDRETFNDLFRREAKNAGCSIGEFERHLASKAFVGSDAVHSWRMGNSGPGDLEKIELVAAALGVRRETLLKGEEGKGVMTSKLTNRKLEALRRIYGAVIEYQEDFLYTCGFNDCWFDLIDAGIEPKNVEEALYELVQKKWRSVELAAKKEGLDLRGEPVYDMLLDYIYNDLIDIYDGKLSYAYRFEAPVLRTDGGTSGVLLEDDYESARKRLHEILDEWV